MTYLIERLAELRRHFDHLREAGQDQLPTAHCSLLTADTSLESWITTHLKAYSDLCLAEDSLCR
jgi:hypothetical protein